MILSITKTQERKRGIVIFLILITVLFLTAWLPFTALADEQNGQEEAVGASPPPSTQIQRGTRQFFRETGYQVNETPGGVPIALRIGVLVNTALLLVGMIFLILTVYSGIQWMTAGGNEERVTRARQRITRATLGLIIVLGAWVITRFVLNAVFGPTRPPRPAIQLFRRF